MDPNVELQDRFLERFFNGPLAPVGFDRTPPQRCSLAPLTRPDGLLLPDEIVQPARTFYECGIRRMPHS